MTRIALFPGQGSQKKGMGRELFSQFPLLMRRVDAELGYSLEELCLEDPGGKLGKTEYTQVALYVVNALSYFASLRDGARPSIVAGHSLGEYNALLAAEVFDFMTGLRLVRKRGELMAAARGGGMAAVVGVEPEVVERLLEEGGRSSISVANYNAPKQTVIAGLADDVVRVQGRMREAGARVVPLNVSGAFHSPHMADAKRSFEEYIRPLLFSRPSIEVMSNVTGLPYEYDSLKQSLAEQIVRPVRWTSILRHVLRHADADVREVGPGTVLTGLVQQMRSAA